MRDSHFARGNHHADRFELGWLTGRSVATLAEVREAAASLTSGSERAVLVTSPPISDGHSGVFAVGANEEALFRTPRIANVPHGAGDAFSAMIAAGLSVGAALGHLQALVEASSGADRLAIVSARTAGHEPRRSRASGFPPRRTEPMAFDFILMLTANDRTIPDAPARLVEALEGGVRHIGFKDVGLPIAELRGLADTIRAAGGRSYPEVVSLDEEKELASARAAVGLDVDCLLGGTRANIVTEVIRDHPIRYYPFPGHITGHPSILEGTEEEIVASARRLADLEHVHGLDLPPIGIMGTYRS